MSQAAQTHTLRDQIDAIALLKADHRECEALFEKFEGARGASTKQKIANKICTALKVHCIIEEEIFYPACEGSVDDDMLEEAYVEHDGAKVLINEIEDSDPNEEFYDAKVKVLKEIIEHHVKEEERQRDSIFAQVRASQMDTVVLGEKMAARKEELMALADKGELGPAEPAVLK